MKRTIRRRVRRRVNGIDIAADVNAVVVTNRGAGTSHASSRQEVTIRQGGDDEGDDEDEPSTGDESASDEGAPGEEPGRP